VGSRVWCWVAKCCLRLRRVALRLGAKNVDIACLEPGDKMLAVCDEIEQGEEEGIIIHNSRTLPGFSAMAAR